MRPIDFFADRLDQIFEQGMPTKAQIYDAFHKANDVVNDDIKIKELKKEDIKYRHFLTVGDLKKFLEKHNLPDDAPVLIQRVEDVYYEKHGWGVYLKEGETYNDFKRWNEDVKYGKYLDKEKYPKMDSSSLQIVPEEDMNKFKEQYHPAWCCVWYKDDEDVLFLDLHY